MTLAHMVIPPALNNTLILMYFIYFVTLLLTVVD